MTANVRAMVASLDVDRLIGVRDRALLLLGFAAPSWWRSTSPTSPTRRTGARGDDQAQQDRPGGRRPRDRFLLADGARCPVDMNADDLPAQGRNGIGAVPLTATG
jgi:hypothetical protein